MIEFETKRIFKSLVIVICTLRNNIFNSTIIYFEVVNENWAMNFDD